MELLDDEPASRNRFLPGVLRRLFVGSLFAVLSGLRSGGAAAPLLPHVRHERAGRLRAARPGRQRRPTVRPRDAAGWYVVGGLLVFFAITWLFVRTLEKQGCYLRV